MEELKELADLQDFNDIKEYQAFLKEMQALLGYCKKISQGIENLDEKSGERAIWELVQNARDLDENCEIKIKLLKDRIIFSHHGKPFDYTSLLALVNQNSSKDDPGANLVGQYGTGFMTTHAFNDIVSLEAPYRAMNNPRDLKGFVKLSGFKLNRSYIGKNEMYKAIKEMRDEMNLVDDMHECTPLFSSLNEMDEASKWTSFTYMLSQEKVASVSEQLLSAIRLMPFVLVINERIKIVEVEDLHTKVHFKIKKTDDIKYSNLDDDENWRVVVDSIVTTDLKNNYTASEAINSLQSKDGKDVIILPPYPASCEHVTNIPSLFLCFPLLGSENFGVNFIFHSTRFYPVEKRNNILLPENVPSKIEKGQHNELVIKEMMHILHKYYNIQGNDATLCREMCIVKFHSDKEDEVTSKFYADMQDMWKLVVPSWNVIPTIEGKKPMNHQRVRVLHPDFYSKLTAEKRKEYEPIIATFAKMAKYSDTETYLLPSTDIIAWSETINQWDCKRDNEFFITVEDVCNAIKNKSDNLHKFLMFLKDSENTSLLDKYALLPNRKGVLRKKSELNNGDFMTTEVYDLVNILMADDVNKMIDTSYLDITTVGAYNVSDLHKAITNTIANWRKSYLNINQLISFPSDQLNALITFCSTTSQPEFNNQRGRLMKLIPKLFTKEFKQKFLPKLEEKEDDFYSASFNFIIDFTLLTLSTKQVDWVKSNKTWLLDFLSEFASSNDKDWVGKLDLYGVIPNQLNTLYIKKELLKNNGVKDDLAEIYQTIFAKDLHEHWVDIEFEDLFVFIEETPEEIAKKIENALEEDIKQEDSKHRHFDKVLRKVILNLNNSDDWKKWFSHIEDKKANYTFNMKDGDVQKSLFTLMDLTDSDLKELADLSEEGKMAEMIAELKRQQQLKYDNNARFYHLHQIGIQIEKVLRNKIGETNIDVEYRIDKSDILIADDIQNGQDIIVKLLVNGKWEEIYYVEVKSKWNFTDPAHMSTRQVRMASLHPDEYSLCCVDLRKHAHENLKELSANDIIQSTKVKMNIGKDLQPMMEKIIEAESRSEDVQIKISEYRSNMSAKVFEIGEPFQALLDKIESIANNLLHK